MMMKLFLPMMLASSTTHAFHIIANTRSYIKHRLGMSYLDNLSAPPSHDTQASLPDNGMVIAEECDPYAGNCIPAGMQFIATGAVVDGEVEIKSGDEMTIHAVNPNCLESQEYFAGFTADSHPAFYIRPNTGTFEPGKSKYLQVVCDPDVQGEGEYQATLVINIPGDNNKNQFTYNVRALNPQHHRQAGQWGAGRNDDEIKASKAKKAAYDIDQALNVDAYSLGAVGGIMPGVQLTGLCGDD
mmetsp:Transcript_63360/g.94017  ORF Transcript_63360/g.94017 Transcript_63360/m.94017 type:complete len:242 (+) Transcript_63360:308-1033(+)